MASPDDKTHVDAVRQIVFVLRVGQTLGIHFRPTPPRPPLALPQRNMNLAVLPDPAIHSPAVSESIELQATINATSACIPIIIRS